MANELDDLEQALASETESFKATKQLLPEEVCGNLTNHGLAPGPDGIGMGKINQDRGLVAYPLAGDDQQGLFCVFDGHGKHGEKVPPRGPTPAAGHSAASGNRRRGRLLAP